MNTRARRRILTTVAVASVSALALAGCSAAADGDTSGGDADEDVTLTITTFGTFGYEDLYKQYEEENPNVTIEATNIDTGGNARTDTFTKIGAGGGLSDIVAIEEGWLGEIMGVSDLFVDLRDYGIEDRKD
ncbi:MAG: carbohydrate ABC transporter substrate-binding protein, partial [Actinomycetota bacterium]